LSTAAAQSSQSSLPDAAYATVGVVGARGYVGRELVRLALAHPRLRLAFASSESGAGNSISDEVPGAPDDLQYESLNFARVHSDPPDIIVLALPNGESERFMQGFAPVHRKPRLVLDVGADHRFDDAWTYGLAESFAPAIVSASQIANPGCYATAMHLALRPLVGNGAVSACCFGVSGYSGAGATPSERNNPDVLRDNLLPYSLSGHLHERESSRHLGLPLRFAPSVAVFFRGIVLTAMITLDEPMESDALVSLYDSHYASSPLVRTLGRKVPSLHDVVASPFADVGGLEINRDDPRQVTAVCALDNLLKGAASQAIQNINLAMGWPVTEGLLP
jgi:N-acetyl-gamma-glutamyl-phosphate reductase